MSSADSSALSEPEPSIARSQRISVLSCEAVPHSRPWSASDPECRACDSAVGSPGTTSSISAMPRSLLRQLATVRTANEPVVVRYDDVEQISYVQENGKWVASWKSR